MLRRLAVGAVALLTACGAAANGSNGASIPPGATPAVALSDADSGRTVPLPAGQEALLRLSSRYTWSGPSASGPVVRVTRAGAQAWTIAAVRPGTARITASGRPPCSPGQLCPDIVLAFSITVTVT